MAGSLEKASPRSPPAFTACHSVGQPHSHLPLTWAGSRAGAVTALQGGGWVGGSKAGEALNRPEYARVHVLRGGKKDTWLMLFVLDKRDLHSAGDIHRQRRLQTQPCHACLCWRQHPLPPVPPAQCYFFCLSSLSHLPLFLSLLVVDCIAVPWVPSFMTTIHALCLSPLPHLQPGTGCVKKKRKRREASLNSHTNISCPVPTCDIQLAGRDGRAFNMLWFYPIQHAAIADNYPARLYRR